MNLESAELSQMKAILETDPNVILVPKRPFQIPQIDVAKIGKLVGSEEIDAAQENLEILLGFVKSDAVFDLYGKDKDSRRAWRTEMLEQYGELFRSLYHKDNQLTRNNLSSCLYQIDWLKDAVKEHGNVDLADKLHKTWRALFKKLNGKDKKSRKKVGKDYNELKSLEDKIVVVHFFEDKVLEILGFFSS